MAPAVVFLEDDWEIPQQPPAEEREMPEEPTAGEDWDSELLVPAQGRLVYVGQGQNHYTFFHQPTPGLQYPKRKRKKRGKKKASSPQPPPPPEPTPLPPAPIDWSDWEEMCQTSSHWEPEICPPSPRWQPEDWEPDICPPSPREDWDAEIAASQDKEDWDAEIAASQ
jgi:hypothetical protein